MSLREPEPPTLRERHREERWRQWRDGTDDRVRETNPRTAGGRSWPSSPIDVYSAGTGKLEPETHDPDVDGPKHLVEHAITVTVSNFEVPDGGTPVSWATVDGAPRDQVGWSQVSLPQASLVSDLTGTLDVDFTWRWRDGYRDAGAVTVAVGGDTESFTPPLALSGGPVQETGMHVEAGEAVVVSLPNNSGSAQYVDATLQLEVRETVRTRNNVAAAFWTVDIGTFDLVKIAADATVLETYDFSTFEATYGQPAGLAVVDDEVYVNTGTQVVKFNKGDGTGTVQFTWAFSSDTNGLVWDGSAWWTYRVDAGGPWQVVKADTDGTQLLAGTNLVPNNAVVDGGLAYDGTYIIALDTVGETLILFDPADGTVVTQVSYEASDDEPWTGCGLAVLEAGTSLLWLSVLADDELVTAGYDGQAVSTVVLDVSTSYYMLAGEL